MTQLWQCTRKLKLLAGEWAAFFVINRYNQQGADWGEFAPNLSDRVMFESYQMNESSHVVFGEAYQFLEKAHVIKREARNFVANCQYSEITFTINSNLDNVDSTLDYSFFNLAGNWLSYFGNSEKSFVIIEEKCKPLFDKLKDEGFCRQLDNRYYWTSKIRPMLELYGQWPSSNSSSPTIEERLMASFSSSLKDRLYHLASTNQKVMACKVLKDEIGVGVSVSKPFLENYMFPKIWGQTKEEKPIIWRWFGP